MLVLKFNKLVGELNKISEKYGLRFISGTYDSEGNLRAITVSDSEEDREVMVEELEEYNKDFNTLVANKFTEEEMH
jgi:hypothetical protein